MKVVLLLAGRGRRLGAITKQNNKCLIKLFDKPLLGHIIDRLLFNNLSDIVPIVGYHSQTIISYLVDNYDELEGFDEDYFLFFEESDFLPYL